MGDYFQVGGSLHRRAPSYVRRQADETLYQALLDGRYCYLLNARQMGKSSLLVRTVQRLQEQGDGYRCAVLDMAHQGSAGVTEAQWYKGIATELWREFDLYSVMDLPRWWRAREDVSPQYRLYRFIRDQLLPNCAGQRLVIFLDEIDAVLGLGFPADDFFALIRACYNERACGEESDFLRLSVVLVGVATPGNLIANPAITPFNIGTAIELSGFSPFEVAPLQAGLPYPDAVAGPMMAAILHWTGGQPFLTQKLCLLASTPGRTADISDPRALIDRLVRERIIDRWEHQDEPQHLRTIRDRLDAATVRTPQALVEYAQLLEGATPRANAGPAQTVLTLAGLVVNDGGRLRIGNHIYRQIFDTDWVAARLAERRPYSQSLHAWTASGRRDSSRLLHGQALRDAQHWAQDKDLDSLDQQYLLASTEAEHEQSEIRLKAERADAMAAALAQQQKTTRLQRTVLALLAISLIGTALSGMLLYSQYQRAQIARQEALELARQARIDQVEALHLSFLANFEANQRLTGLLQAIEASTMLARIDDGPPRLAARLRDALRRAVFETDQYNELSGHGARVGGVASSPDGELIATASADDTIRLWHKDGSLKTTLKGHTAEVRAVEFSPDGQLIVSASSDASIRLWRLTGEPVANWTASKGGILDVAFAPDGHSLAAVGDDKALFLWSRDGRLRHAIPAHDALIWAVAYRPDGRLIATASSDASVKLWSSDGALVRVLEGHGGAVRDVALSPRMIATASDDATVKLWDYQGQLIRTLTGHRGPVQSVRFSTDGALLVSGAEDARIIVWRTADGTPIKTLAGHRARVLDVEMAADNATVISASMDNTVRLWRIDKSLRRVLYGHSATIRQIAFSPDGKHLVSGSMDGSVRLWDLDGQTASRLIGHHDAPVKGVAISPDQRLIASAGEDALARLWRFDGTPVTALSGHEGGVKAVAFDQRGDIIVTGASDRSVRLWNRSGVPLASLTGHDAAIWGVNTGPDGRIASASLDDTARIWDRQGRELMTLRGHEAVVARVAFSPDGQRLASASFDGTIGLWRADGSLIKRLNGHDGEVFSVDFSPDGRTIASASRDGTVKLWRPDGELITTLDGHDAPVWSAVFSPDGGMLASAGVDGRIMLWDIAQLTALDELAYACAWVADLLNNNQHLSAQKRAICD